MPWGLAAVAVITAVGAVMQSQAASGAASYNKKVAEQNAQLATQNAQWAGAEGEQKVGVAGIQAKSEAGSVKTAQAANNIDVNSGSAVQVQQSQQEATLLNTSNIRSNAARQAYGYETQSTQSQGQSNLYGAEAGFDNISGGVNAAGSVAKGIAGYEEFGGSSGGSNPTGTPGASQMNGSLLGQSGGSNWQPYSQSSSLF